LTLFIVPVVYSVLDDISIARITRGLVRVIPGIRKRASS
jgi:hypothetical protein